MNKLTIKITAIILLFTIFFFAQSNRAEANPAVIAVGAVALGTVLVAGALVSYYKPVSALPYNSSVSTAGNIGLIALAAHNIMSQYGVAEMQSKLVTLRAKMSDIQAALKPYFDNASATPPVVNPFPNLSDAYLKGVYTYDPSVCDVPENIDAYYVNVTENGVPKNFKVGAKIADSTTRFNWPSPEPPFFGLDGTPLHLRISLSTFVSAGKYDQRVRHYAIDGPINVGQYTTPNRTPAEAQQSLGATNSTPAVTSELENLVKAKPSIFKPVDTYTPNDDLDTAPPYVVPPGAISPHIPTVTTVPTGQALDQSRVQANNKTTAAQQAKADADAYKAAHPSATPETDPQYKSLLDALTAAQTAATTATNLKDQLEAEKDITIPGAMPDSLKAIDFSPFLALSGILASKFPFTLLSSIGQYLSVFEGSPTAPVFVIPIYAGNNMTIDLSFMDSVATVSRYLIASLMAIGTVFYIVRRYTD